MDSNWMLPALTLAQTSAPAFNWMWFAIVFPLAFIAVFVIMMVVGKKKKS